MMKFYHRDLLNRVIKIGDYVAWANKSHGANLKIARVVGSHPIRVDLMVVGEDQIRYVTPTNLIVLTQQIRANFEDEYKPENENEELKNWLNSL